MGRPAKINSESIADCAVRLVVNNGHRSTTIRSISKAMGVNEAALYRYYKSKDELLWDAYARIVQKMATEKEELAKAPLRFHEKLREWVRLTFAYFDEHPDAFTYVLLLPPPVHVGETDITHTQGRIFLALAQQARARGEIRAIVPALALSHFSGILLNVPRLIQEKTLPGPASRYLDEVADAAWRILEPTS
jgi:AcrR family transcriptional regulator